MANWKSIKKKIKNSQKVDKIIKKRAKKIFDREKEKVMEQFLSHPVTREISLGPLAQNISGTLGGYGNLYTFIGFRDGSDPVGNVASVLRSIIRLKKITPSRMSDTKYKILIQYPGNEDFTISAPLPWESGRSWVLGIERGISGFGAYIYKNFYKSRSGKGIQAKRSGREQEQKIRSGGFRNIKYMSEMIKQFYINLKKAQ